jgi:hypothetical protein
LSWDNNRTQPLSQPWLAHHKNHTQPLSRTNTHLPPPPPINLQHHTTNTQPLQPYSAAPSNQHPASPLYKTHFTHTPPPSASPPQIPAAASSIPPTPIPNPSSYTLLSSEPYPSTITSRYQTLPNHSANHSPIISGNKYCQYRLMIYFDLETTKLIGAAVSALGS